MLRPLRIACEFLAALAGLTIVLGVFIIWRLNSAPISTDYFTPTIEAAIESSFTGTHATIATSLLSWDNVTHTVTFHADDIVLKDADGAVVGRIPVLGIKLNILGLVFGQFLPTELFIDHPQFTVQRGQDGNFYFTDRTPATAKGNVGNIDLSVLLSHVLDNLSHALITRKLLINRVVIDVHDQTSAHNWAINIPEIALTRISDGLEGTISVNVTQPGNTATLKLHYKYDSDAEQHTLDARFADIVPAAFAGNDPATLGLGTLSVFDLPLTGSGSISLDNKAEIVGAEFNLQAGKGRLIVPALWDKPRTIRSMDIAVHFDSIKKLLTVSKGDFDFDGAKLGVTMTGNQSTNPEQDIDYTLNVQVDHWPLDKFTELWPKPVVPNAREWMAANLSKGIYEHGEATFKGSAKFKDIENLSPTEGQGTIRATGANVGYIDGMPPIQNVNASAKFDLKQMQVAITSGNIGALKIVPFTLSITGLSEYDQFLDLPLKLTGPVTDVLWLIDNPPFKYAQTVGLTPDAIQGQVDGTVNIHLPLLKDLAMHDVGISAEATLSNLASQKLAPPLDLSLGKLSLKLDKTAMELSGTIAANKIPAHIDMEQYFSPPSDGVEKRLNVKTTILGDQWALLGIGDLAGTKGPSTLDASITTSTAGKTKIDGTIDFQKAETKSDILGWRKAAGEKAILTLSAEREDSGNLKISSISLVGQNINVKGKAEIDVANDELLTLKLNPFKIGRTDATLSISRPEGKNGVFHLDAEGKALDVSGLRGGKDQAESPHTSKEYRIDVDRLYTSETGMIAELRGHAVRDPEGWSEIDLYGLADGDQPISIQLKPVGNHRTFSVSSDNFGKALRGLGFGNNVYNGNLRIHGTSTDDDPRTIKGTAKATSFTVKELPALALLLNATSPFGFSGLVTNSTDFDYMKGDYSWTKDQIHLNKVRTAGPSVGLNIEGDVDMNTGNADLRGTIVPFSMINSILGSIPLIGDLITGGDGGGVLAVNYSIKGSLGDPKIGVNPVSLLTPGFLRNLFFDSGSSNDGGAATNDDTTPYPIQNTLPAAKNNLRCCQGQKK